MKQPCKYHPGAEAKWHCPHDGIVFCDECVGGDDAEGRVARCLVCNKPLAPVEPLLRQMPFWQALPHFMRYPMTLAALLLMLALAVPLALTGFHFYAIGLLLIAGLGLARYGEAALRAGMEGDLTPPPLSVVSVPDDWPQAVQRWWLFAAAVIASGSALHYLGLWAAFLLVGLWALMLPSLFIGLASFPSLGKALSRVHAAPLVLGRQYLALSAAFMVSGLLVLFAALVLRDLLPHWLAAPLAGLAVGWLYLFLCHLIGYLACQFQDELQIPTESRKRAARRRRNRRPEEERRTMVRLREGQYAKVRGSLEKRLAKTPRSLTDNEQYMKLLLAMSDNAAALATADHYLQALIKADQHYRVAEMIKTLRRLDAGFRPDSPDVCYQVARALNETGEPRLAVWMLKDMHQRAPDWEGVAEAYILMARVLAEKLDSRDKGLQYLKFVEKHYRQPKVREQVRLCREAIGVH